MQQLRALTQPLQAPGAPAAQLPADDSSAPDAPAQVPGSSSADRQGAGTKEAVRAKRKRSAAPPGHASALPALAVGPPATLRTYVATRVLGLSLGEQNPFALGILQCLTEHVLVGRRMRRTC